MNYLALKQQIKSEINKSYGTVKQFIEKNPQLNQTESKLCNQLAPHRDAHLSKLQPIAEALGYTISLVKKV